MRHVIDRLRTAWALGSREQHSSMHMQYMHMHDGALQVYNDDHLKAKSCAEGSNAIAKLPE